MLLLATTLVGLATVSNAAYIGTTTASKAPPVGYTSGAIELMDGETGKFTWDLQPYFGVDYPAWQAGWSRQIAIQITQKTITGGALAADSLKVAYSSLLGTSRGDIVHTNPRGTGVADGTLNQFWCGRMDSTSNGLDLNLADPVELSFMADCTGTVNSCSLGVEYVATLWFYQISNSDPAWTDVVYDLDWGQKNCFGQAAPFWNAVAQQDSGNFALDFINRPSMFEGYTASFQTQAFSDFSTGSTSSVNIYSGQITTTGNVFPVLSTWVERDTSMSESGLGLYAKFSASTLDFASKFFFCFQSTTAGTLANAGTVWKAWGNQEATDWNSNYATYCDLGCYPVADCTIVGQEADYEAGSWDMLNQDINNAQMISQSNFFVHTLTMESTVGRSIPDVKVAFNFGSLPSTATNFGPSALLGMIALAVATMA